MLRDPRNLPPISPLNVGILGYSGPTMKMRWLQNEHYGFWVPRRPDGCPLMARRWRIFNGAVHTKEILKPDEVEWMT